VVIGSMHGPTSSLSERCFHELLSGRRAFEADSIPAVLYAVIHHEPKSLTVARPVDPSGDLRARHAHDAEGSSRRFRSVEEIRNTIRALRVRGVLPPSLTLSELARDATERTLAGSGDLVLSSPSVSYSSPRSATYLTFDG